MRGYAPLEAYRRRGMKPVLVTIDTDPSMYPKAWATQWPVETPGRARLLVEPTESAERLDLRCLLGVSVEVNGTDQRRVREVFDAARDHGASRVIGNVHAANHLDLVEVMDTEGVMRWRAA